jgi:hypothetical protein
LYGNGTVDVSWLTNTSARPFPRGYTDTPSGIDSNVKPPGIVSPTEMIASADEPDGAPARSVTMGACDVLYPAAVGPPEATLVMVAAATTPAATVTAMACRPLNIHPPFTCRCAVVATRVPVC